MYDNASQHYTLPDFDTFCKDMQDEKKRKAAYDALSGTYDLPDYATFTKDVTITTTTPQPQQQSTPTTVKPVTDTTAPSIAASVLAAKYSSAASVIAFISAPEVKSASAAVTSSILGV